VEGGALKARNGKQHKRRGRLRPTELLKAVNMEVAWAPGSDHSVMVMMYHILIEMAISGHTVIKRRGDRADYRKALYLLVQPAAL
jgi:hypothetical protein